MVLQYCKPGYFQLGHMLLFGQDLCGRFGFQARCNCGPSFGSLELNPVLFGLWPLHVDELACLLHAVDVNKLLQLHCCPLQCKHSCQHSAISLLAAPVAVLLCSHLHLSLHFLSSMRRLCGDWWCFPPSSGSLLPSLRGPPLAGRSRCWAASMALAWLWSGVTGGSGWSIG